MHSSGQGDRPREEGVGGSYGPPKPPAQADAEKAPAARAAPVYSLELDTPGYAVYMVNGVLVMD